MLTQHLHWHCSMNTVHVTSVYKLIQWHLLGTDRIIGLSIKVILKRDGMH